MKIKMFLISIILCVSAISYAQETSEITVEDIQICLSVEDRIPSGSKTIFSANIEKLYCFTKLKSTQDADSIVHVWLYNDRVMATIELNTRAKIWRTWSSKRILPSWKGKWRVDIETAEGNLLASKEFEIK